MSETGQYFFATASEESYNELQIFHAPAGDGLVVPERIMLLRGVPYTGRNISRWLSGGSPEPEAMLPVANHIESIDSSELTKLLAEFMFSHIPIEDPEIAPKEHLPQELRELIEQAESLKAADSEDDPPGFYL